MIAELGAKKPFVKPSVFALTQCFLQIFSGDRVPNIVDGAYINENGVLVSYFDGNTFDELKGKYEGLVIYGFDEAIALKQEASKAPVERSTEEWFLNQLNCLPPSKWKAEDCGEAFWSGEPWSGTLYRIYVKIGDDYFTLLDDISLSLDAVIAKCKAFLEKEKTNAN